PRTALNRLATVLGSQFSTTLVQRAGRPPRLVVVDRHTQAATDVYADQHGWFWWPWAEPTAVTNDLPTAGHRVKAVLSGTTPPPRPRGLGAGAPPRTRGGAPAHRGPRRGPTGGGGPRAA